MMANEYWSALIPLLSTLVTVLGSVTIWSCTQKANRVSEERKRREERYQKLLDGLRGFYVSSFDSSLRDEFIRQLNLTWLYCPDAVIKRAYDFLSMCHKGEKYTDQQKELAVGELVVAIRQDMISNRLVRKSKLAASDFKHLRST